MKRRIKQNVWGNIKGYEGTRCVYDFGLNWQGADHWIATGELPKFVQSDWKYKIGPQARRETQ